MNQHSIARIAWIAFVFCQMVVLAQAQTIPNPSFETDGYTGGVGYASGNGGSISGWTVNPANRVGLNPAASSPFADNGAIPDGANVAFIQSDGSTLSTLGTTITGLKPGAVYQVSFRANARAATLTNPNPTWSLNGGAFVPFTGGPPVGGSNPYYTNSGTFTASGTTAALTLANQTATDSTVLVDDFRIVEIPQGNWTVHPWVDDRNTGMDPAETLWAYHFNSAAIAPVNGLGVLGLSGTNAVVAGRFSVAGATATVNNDPNNLSGKPGLGSSIMAKTFIYNGNPTTITLDGLTVGQNYVVSIFSVAWEAAGARRQTFASGSDQRVIDQDLFGNDNGIRIDYAFTADATSRIITITPTGAGTFHLYGLALRTPRRKFLSLNGPSTVTNECHFPYIELGAFSGPIALSAEGNGSLALRSDGTVAAWGDNSRGETNVPSGLSGVVAITGGLLHNLALRNDGQIVGWGYSSEGQTIIPSGLNNVVTISAGGYHNLVLQNNGTVVVWGAANVGQTNIPPDLNNVVAIAGGWFHSLALRSDGTVVSWGWNYAGQTNVPSGLGKVVAIAAGSVHNMALRSDGTVAAWGSNGDGQTNVPSGLSNVVAIAAGGYHSLALRNDGTVAAWGRNNSYGQTNVPSGLNNVVAIASRADHSLALRADGTIVTWGNNSSDQLNIPLSSYLTNGLLTSGNVDNNSPGRYQVSYAYTNVNGSGTVSRTVVVQDTLPPALTINGDSLILITNVADLPFVDPGATASDLCEGDLLINADSNLNVGFPGIYTITYQATDSSGNAANLTRTIYVMLPAATPGDQNGDGVVDGSELNAVYANYAANSPWLLMTNVAGLGGTNVVFELNGSPLGTFPVEYSTNLLDWLPLGPAVPRYLFNDTDAPAGPQRYYRLRHP